MASYQRRLSTGGYSSSLNSALPYFSLAYDIYSGMQDRELKKRQLNLAEKEEARLGRQSEVEYGTPMVRPIMEPGKMAMSDTGIGGVPQHYTGLGQTPGLAQQRVGIAQRQAGVSERAQTLEEQKFDIERKARDTALTPFTSEEATRIQGAFGDIDKKTGLDLSGTLKEPLNIINRSVGMPKFNVYEGLTDWINQKGNKDKILKDLGKQKSEAQSKGDGQTLLLLDQIIGQVKSGTFVDSSMPIVAAYAKRRKAESAKAVSEGQSLFYGKEKLAEGPKRPKKLKSVAPGSSIISEEGDVVSTVPGKGPTKLQKANLEIKVRKEARTEIETEHPDWFELPHTVDPKFKDEYKVELDRRVKQKMKGYIGEESGKAPSGLPEMNIPPDFWKKFVPVEEGETGISF